MSFPKPRPRTTAMPVPTHTSAQAGETHFPERGRKRTSLAVTLTAGLVALTLVACSNGEPTAEETVDVYQIAQERANAEASASASASAAGIDLEEANTQASQEARANALPSLSPELAAQREEAWDAERPTLVDDLYDGGTDGAKAVAITFLEGYRYAFMTGDTSVLEEICERQSVYCNSVIENATSMHEEGGWCDWWEITVHSFEYWELQEGAEYSRLEVTFSFDEIHGHTGSDSEEVVADSYEEGLYIFAVRFADGQWKIGEVELSDE